MTVEYFCTTGALTVVNVIQIFECNHSIFSVHSNANHKHSPNAKYLTLQMFHLMCIKCWPIANILFICLATACPEMFNGRLNHSFSHKAIGKSSLPSCPSTD